MRRCAQVEIVPREGAANAVIGPLCEAAEMIADAAGDEQAHLIDRNVVIR